jgi:hypothetical protein
MGMYDTINGEQVKCFPWVSLYHKEISYHGGDLAYYGIGSEVPYKRPHYNYGKNFIILDLNRYIDSDYCPYDYILHVIVDGKVKETFENEIGDIDWSINKNVVGYTGELLNINSSEDLLNYMAAQRKYWSDYEKIRSYWNELFSQLSNCMHGFGVLDKESEERKIRKENFDRIHELMKEEEKRIEPELNNLREEHSKWFVDTSDIDDLINLGDYISAYYTELKAERDENVKACSEMISKLLESDDTLCDRYLKWQEIEDIGI